MENIFINPRQKSILRVLFDKKDWVKGSDIANETGVTVRTIRNDISYMNSAYEGEPIIISSKRKGYSLSNRQKVIDILKMGRSDIPIYPQERINYIFKRLLFKKSKINVYDLADEMLVSTPTVENDISKIKEIIDEKKQDIYLSKKSEYIYLSGNEKDKRALLSELLFEETNESFLDVSKYIKYFQDFDLGVIQDIFLSAVQESNLEINEMAIINLIIHIAISIERIKSGHIVGMFSNTEDITSMVEYKLAQEVTKQIDNKLNIEFPEQEVFYLAYLILGKKILISKSGNPDELVKIVEPYFIDITKSLLVTIEMKFGVNLMEDDDLLAGLSLHIKAMVDRIKNEVMMRNPALNDLKRRYPFVFEISVFFSDEFFKKTGLKMDENEIGFVALHIGAALERIGQKNTSKKKVALVCTKGYNTSDILLSKISSNFGDKIEIVGVFTFLEINKILDNNPDFVISTINIEGKINIPIIVVSQFLDTHDIRRINSHLNFFEEMAKLKHLQIEIEKHFKEDLFFQNVKLDDRFDVIRFMTENIHTKNYVPQNYGESVIKRENISSTSFGNLVAIPHSIVMNAYDTVISVAILDKPIGWGNYKVQLVFMFAIKENDRAELKNLYNYLMKIIDDQDAINYLIKSKSFDDFKDGILNYKIKEII